MMSSTRSVPWVMGWTCASSTTLGSACTYTAKIPTGHPQTHHTKPHLLVPLEVRGDGELHAQGAVGDGLDVRLELDLGQSVHVLVDALAQLGDADQLANLRGREVIESLPVVKTTKKGAKGQLA